MIHQSVSQYYCTIRCQKLSEHYYSNSIHNQSNDIIPQSVSLYTQSEHLDIASIFTQKEPLTFLSRVRNHFFDICSLMGCSSLVMEGMLYFWTLLVLCYVGLSLKYEQFRVRTYHMVHFMAHTSHASYIMQHTKCS